MTAPSNPWLIAGAAGCGVAALAHLAVIAGGPDWYRWFGAGEPMARAAERGNLIPAIAAVGIAAALALSSSYALAGAGLIGRLPLMRLALVVISAILLGRGLAVLVPGAWRPDLTFAFKLWSSLIVLALGACYALGTWQAWPALSNRSPG